MREFERSDSLAVLWGEFPGYYLGKSMTYRGYPLEQVSLVDVIPTKTRDAAVDALRVAEVMRAVGTGNELLDTWSEKYPQVAVNLAGLPLYFRVLAGEKLVGSPIGRSELPVPIAAEVGESETLTLLQVPRHGNHAWMFANYDDIDHPHQLSYSLEIGDQVPDDIKTVTALVTPSEQKRSVSDESPTIVFYPHPGTDARNEQLRRDSIIEGVAGIFAALPDHDVKIHVTGTHRIQDRHYVAEAIRQYQKALQQAQTTTQQPPKIPETPTPPTRTLRR